MIDLKYERKKKTSKSRFHAQRHLSAPYPIITPHVINLKGPLY